MVGLDGEAETDIAGFPGSRKPRPYSTCRERIWPPETTPRIRWTVAGFALQDHLYVSRRKWRDDFLAAYPDRLPLADAMFLAHELTHVWQWQHTARTGYSAFAAASEHGDSDDPYRFELTPGKPFLSYGYEQQAALVEEGVLRFTHWGNSGKSGGGRSRPTRDFKV